MWGDDVLDEITGSIGLTGAVDGALILKRERGQHEASLFVTGRDIEHEQQLALRFDAQTVLWTQVGNAEEVTRTKERQDILDLLNEQFPEGMTPRQVAEALDKNYHTTRCLLRKLEVAGLIQHADSQYVAIPVENSRNQSDYSHQRNQCNHRNQSVPSALQHDDQIARSEKLCLPTSDYADYVGKSVSANVSQMLSIPPFGGCSLQFPSASEDILPQREYMQEAQEHRDVGVINRNQCNQCNQSMSVTTQASDHVEQYPAPCSDYVDYTDYANESVSADRTQTHEPDPPPTGVSLRYLPEAKDLLTERGDIQGTPDHRVDYADGVINLISHVLWRRYGLSITKASWLLIAMFRLLEKHGQAHILQARNVVLIIRMCVGSALIRLVKPGATRWTAGIATAPCRNIPEALSRLSKALKPGLPS